MKKTITALLVAASALAVAGGTAAHPVRHHGRYMDRHHGHYGHYTDRRHRHHRMMDHRMDHRGYR